VSYRSKKPRLDVRAYVGEQFPGSGRYLSLYCVNSGYQPIMVTDIVFQPNRFMKVYVKPHPGLEDKNLSVNQTPKMLLFSEYILKNFDLEVIGCSDISRHVDKRKWLEIIKLKMLWKVVAITPVKNFQGRLSKSLIDTILKERFEKIVNHEKVKKP
ncbi:MAG TPA: hypothetical protein VD770_01485, partial [Coxiellaceae bacterium]|nr:hypothetical protein [Coxiellaceae bacterium]